MIDIPKLMLADYLDLLDMRDKIREMFIDADPNAVSNGELLCRVGRLVGVL